jgi:ABC-type polar amino acid transport system ATPase subunit
MLFDEPTSALDVELVREVLDVMEGSRARDDDGRRLARAPLSHHVASSILMMDEGGSSRRAPPAQFSPRRRTSARGGSSRSSSDLPE